MLLDLTQALSKKPPSEISQCGGQCKLNKHCTGPIEPTIGTNGILIIADTPTEAEDSFGEGFLGTPGKRIKKVIKDAGVNPEECSFTYAVRCYGEHDDKSIASCRIRLLKTIEKVNPHTILLFGQTAVSSVLSYDYEKPAGSVNNWVGFQIPSRKFNAWLCPNYSITTPYHKEDPAMDLLFDRYITAALKHTKRPWEEIPDETKEIEIVDSEEAVKRIQRYRQHGGMVAWDLETHSLKSDGPHAAIYSCSICHMGKETISFLWDDNVQEAMRRLLQSGRTQKIGANIKYETRYVKSIMGIDIKGWVHDTVIAAHVLDCRPNITSLKIQSYLRFGLPDYADHIKQYFKSDGSNSPNKIEQCDVKALLLYGGQDSLLTYRIAVEQMREFGQPFPSN